MEVFPRFDLNGQVALVTGAARGLGRAISLALAAAGADVALGLRDINAAGGLPAGIRALGRRVLPLQTDMTRLDQITGAIDHVVRDFRSPRYLGQQRRGGSGQSSRRCARSGLSTSHWR
jgi:NAD(P)-dependent dehydrogenase (short-subunit alcohol dehydrogenase family)